jgi:hypothetical protein
MFDAVNLPPPGWIDPPRALGSLGLTDATSNSAPVATLV